MGHSNYWRRKPELPAKAFATAVKDCKKIIQLLGVTLGGPDGTGMPIFRADEIIFNGKAPESYETFAVRRIVEGRDENSRAFEFCKTDQRPYDLCVQAALIVLKHYLAAAISVSSDGSDAEWERARELCEKWLGYGGEFRLEG